MSDVCLYRSARDCSKIGVNDVNASRSNACASESAPRMREPAACPKGAAAAGGERGALGAGDRECLSVSCL